MRRIIVILEEAPSYLGAVLIAIPLFLVLGIFFLDFVLAIWYWLLIEVAVAALVAFLLGMLIGYLFSFSLCDPEEALEAIFALAVIICMTVFNYRLYYSIAESPSKGFWIGVASFLWAFALGAIFEGLFHLGYEKQNP